MSSYKLCDGFVIPSNTVIHAYAKAGGTEAAVKAQELLNKMRKLHQEGNQSVKPDTITL